jgi:hypothetical protein
MIEAVCVVNTSKQPLKKEAGQGMTGHLNLRTRIPEVLDG